MKGALIGLAVIVVLALILGGSLMGSRNELITERESINGAFAQVDTALQRRNDLIPNLVETVKGMAKQEQYVIDSVTKARAAASSSCCDPTPTVAASIARRIRCTASPARSS